jgi:dienelactone hydrolase
MKSLLLLLSLLATAAPAQMAAPPVEMSDPGVTGKRIATDGIIGNFYPAQARGRHAAILLLGGSEGALGAGSTRIAKALQADGFNVLHLSYFRAPGQSEALVHVPVETFAKGLAWLSRQPSVDPGSIGLVGGSKGGEAVLLIASRTPSVRAVVAGMPSSVIWPGMSWTAPVEGSSWSAGGADLPALPYGRFAPPTIGSVYENGLAKAAEHPDTAIPIEKSTAPVLLVCGEADTLWPSCPMARQLKARDPRVTVLNYADAGHAVFGPPVDPTSPGYPRLGALGGSSAGNAAARVDGWPKVLAFLHKALGG